MAEKYTDINARTVDGWVKGGWEWGVPISREGYQKALRGEMPVYLTPTKPVPAAWFPPMTGCRVLGLASGGAQQMPVFAAWGAHCIVLDYSNEQLKSERMVAEREGYQIQIVRHDMTQPLPFPAAAFDLIFHPVSNCYVEDVLPVWRECFRALRPGGVLLSGLDMGWNYLFDEEERCIANRLPYNPLKDPEILARDVKNNAGVQFSHTVEDQIGGQIRAGFILTDLYEDTNGSGNLHDHGVPSFCATRSLKPD